MAAALGLVLLAAAPGATHPHVFIEYAVLVHFGASGLEGVRVSWVFDDFYSSVILREFDTNRDGVFSPAEARVIEQKHFAILREHHYFVELRMDGKPVAVRVRDFQARALRGRVTYEFGVPVPGAPSQGTLETVVDDPTFYTAFIPVERDPIRVQAPREWRAECRVAKDGTGAKPDAVACRFGRAR